MMKLHFLFAKIFTLILITALTISCKDKTTQKPKDDTQTEIASVAYKCPMDCEKGKVYTEKGNCPVCKMDLAKVEQNTEECKQGKNKCSEAKNCTSNKECKKENCEKKDCKKEDCKKEDCKEVKKGDCTKQKKESNCTCTDKKDCKCEEGKCKCAKCPEHTK